MRHSSTIFEIGHYGGIFWRVHKFAKAGDFHCGHRHLINHATLISSGGVRCEIEEQEPREYWAPAVIEIDKDTRHQFTALADGTTYFCVFASSSEASAAGFDDASEGDRFGILAGLFCNGCTGCDL